jgi:hypothetical protein
MGGYVLFDGVPDRLTAIGSLIITTGLYGVRPERTTAPG